MTAPNTKIEISVEDMEVIEHALRASLRAQTNHESTIVHELLGRLHNQKVFFRPRNGAYVGG